MTSQWALRLFGPISLPDGVDLLSRWQNDWIGRVTDLRRRKVKGKSLLTKVISQKQRRTPRGVEEINNIIKAFKDSELVTSPHPHLTLSLASGEGRWALDSDSGLA